jgi:heme-degrading monooxygenase HmoA
MTMFVVMNRLRCAPSFAEHLERSFAHAGNMEGVAGCLAFQFLKRLEKAPEAENVEYIALTQWRDYAAYHAWLKSEAFAGTHASAGANPVTVTIEHFELLQS